MNTLSVKISSVEIFRRWKFRHFAKFSSLSTKFSPIRYLETLEDQGIIYKRDGKRYYHVRDDYEDDVKDIVINTHGQITDENNDETGNNNPSSRNLIDMIKENMYEEKLRNSDLIDYLKEQIKFFQDELREKNKVINKLLEKEASYEKIETSRERSTLTNIKSNIKHQIQKAYQRKITSQSEITREAQQKI